MMTTQLENQCREFLAGFFMVFPKYQKIDSASNRAAISGRMASFEIEPSLTSAKRAILELLNEGVIDRTDGLTEDDDRRLADEAAQRREEARLSHLRSKGCPTNREEYFRIPNREILLRYRREPEFKAAVDSLIAAGQI